MKTSTLTLLLWVITTGFCYKPDTANDNFIFRARIDGQTFNMNENRCSVMLVNQPASLDGRRPARKIISIIQNGPSYVASNGRLFNETIQFEINVDENMNVQPDVYSVALQYHSVVYSVIKNPGDIQITSFSSDPDHRHYHISFNFNCTMRSWGYPADGEQDVKLEGEFRDITLANPSVLSATAAY